MLCRWRAAWTVAPFQSWKHICCCIVRHLFYSAFKPFPQQRHVSMGPLSGGKLCKCVTLMHVCGMFPAINGLSNNPTCFIYQWSTFKYDIIVSKLICFKLLHGSLWKQRHFPIEPFAVDCEKTTRAISKMLLMCHVTKWLQLRSKFIRRRLLQAENLPHSKPQAPAVVAKRAEKLTIRPHFTTEKLKIDICECAQTNINTAPKSQALLSVGGGRRGAGRAIKLICCCFYSRACSKPNSLKLSHGGKLRSSTNSQARVRSSFLLRDAGPRQQLAFPENVTFSRCLWFSCWWSSPARPNAFWISTPERHV